MLPHKAIGANAASSAAVAMVRGYACRESALAELGMLVAMAAMFAFPATPVEVWWATFVGIGTVLVVQLAMARSRLCRPSGRHLAASCYHLLAVAAMLYMVIGHPRHSPAMHAGGLAGPPAPLLGWIFVIVFTLDALAVAGIVLATPGRPRLAASAAPHLVMDIAMITMLGAALTGPAAH